MYKDELYYAVGQLTNGTTGTEWLKDEQHRLRLFKGTEMARAYLKKTNNISDSAIENNYVFRIAEIDEIVKGVITTA